MWADITRSIARMQDQRTGTNERIIRRTGFGCNSLRRLRLAPVSANLSPGPQELAFGGEEFPPVAAEQNRAISSTQKACKNRAFADRVD